jgi:hypothetical protein
MKTKIVLALVFCAVTFHLQAQISFQKGYFINKNNEKTECFIKNLDWKNNPTEFTFKRNINSEDTSIATINNVTVFEIYDVVKFKKATVDIDISSSNLNRLDSKRAPNFKKQTVFLKFLVQGETSLLSYKKNNLVRYFVDNGVKIEQLIYKKFYTPSGKVGINKHYQQQLLNLSNCKKIVARDVQKLKYKASSLSRFFQENFNCNDIKTVSYASNKNEKNIHIIPKIGLGSYSLTTENSVSESRSIDFDNQIGVRFGVEFAYTLPFNNKKWRAFIEPTYQKYTSEKSQNSTNVSGGVLKAEVDYSSLEIPIGIKHFFFLNNESKIFLSGSYILDIPFSSSLTYKRNDNSVLDTVEISSASQGFGFGVGYEYDRYSIGARYTSRNIMSDSITFSSDYNSLAISFGYSF